MSPYKKINLLGASTVKDLGTLQNFVAQKRDANDALRSIQFLTVPTRSKSAAIALKSTLPRLSTVHNIYHEVRKSSKDEELKDSFRPITCSITILLLVSFQNTYYLGINFISTPKFILHIILFYITHNLLNFENQFYIFHIFKVHIHISV